MKRIIPFFVLLILFIIGRSACAIIDAGNRAVQPISVTDNEYQRITAEVSHAKLDSAAKKEARRHLLRKK